MNAEALGGFSGKSTKPISGINLASGEFAPGKLPGRYGFDYVYPDRTTAAPFLTAGVQVVRVPILWERLQRAAGSELDADELKRIDQMILEMRDFSLIILDIHNYGRFSGTLLDASLVSRQVFSNLWSRLAVKYKNSPNIVFGLMNEPNGISAKTARSLMDAAISAIRSAGAKNLVLIPGTRWSGAHSWTQGGEDSNANAFSGFRDPANNFMFELHNYIDDDASGTKAECPSESIGVERLLSVTAWLRKERAKALLGEFGSSRNSTCLKAMGGMLDYMEANSDVWYGWTYWAGGAWWGDYFMSVPAEGRRDQAPDARADGPHRARQLTGMARSPASRRADRGRSRPRS